MSNPKFPNPTPRMVFGAAAIIFFIVLTMLVPKWLIVLAAALAWCGVVFCVIWAAHRLQDNEW